MTEPNDVPKAGDLSQAEQPADPAPPSADMTAAETPAEELAAPMNTAPPPHTWLGLIQTRRDFVLQIAVVAIGVLLAIGLEQAVEAARHAQQRAQLEEQMHDMLEANTQIIADDLRILADFRAHLVELQRAVVARRHGRATPTAPLASDPRARAYAPPPILGAYQAAKATGTVTLLSFSRVRLYDRLAFQYDFALDEVRAYIDAIRALRAFRQRFNPSEEIGGSQSPTLPVDLALLSSADLIEYQALIGDALAASVGYTGRLRRLDIMGRAILRGVRNEEELLQAITNATDDAGAATPSDGRRDQP